MFGHRYLLVLGTRVGAFKYPVKDRGAPTSELPQFRHGSGDAGAHGLWVYSPVLAPGGTRVRAYTGGRRRECVLASPSLYPPVPALPRYASGGELGQAI